MATLTKCEDAVLQMWSGTHNFLAAGNVFNIAIHSDALVAGTDVQLSNLVQITGTGYAPIDMQNDVSETAGTATWTGVDVEFAPGAETDWGAGRYLTIYNDSSTDDKLIGTYDYGESFTLDAGETMTVDFGASVGTLV